MLRLASRCWSRAGVRAFATDQLQVALEPLDGSIFLLTLNRPEARNAIGRQFLRELKESLDNLVLERSTRCVIIKSSVSRVFCAGADLKVLAGGTACAMGTACSSRTCCPCAGGQGRLLCEA